MGLLDDAANQGLVFVPETLGKLHADVAKDGKGSLRLDHTHLLKMVSGYIKRIDPLTGEDPHGGPRCRIRDCQHIPGAPRLRTLHRAFHRCQHGAMSDGADRSSAGFARRGNSQTSSAPSSLTPARPRSGAVSVSSALAVIGLPHPSRWKLPPISPMGSPSSVASTTMRHRAATADAEPRIERLPPGTRISCRIDSSQGDL